jgi:hypothetical protein
MSLERRAAVTGAAQPLTPRVPSEGTNCLRRFYMVEGISYRLLGSGFAFSGRKARISVSVPCPKRGAYSVAIHVGTVRRTWQEPGPVRRRNGARIGARNGTRK